MGLAHQLRRGVEPRLSYREKDHEKKKTEGGKRTEKEKNMRKSDGTKKRGVGMGTEDPFPAHWRRKRRQRRLDLKRLKNKGK